MATWAVDFDDVIHDRLHPLPARRMGPPMPGALEGIQRLLGAGHHVIVFTQRGDDAHRGHVEDWLRFYGFPPLPVTNIKGAFDQILDDRATTFHSWAEVEP